MSTTSSKKRKDIWAPNERHYCKECNCWLASDRQSILFHENARRHQNNVINNLKKRKYEKDKSDREQENLQKSLRDIERIANLSHIANDGKIFGSVSNAVSKKPSLIGSSTSKYYDESNLYCQVAGGGRSEKDKKDVTTSWRENLRQARKDEDGTSHKTQENKEVKQEKKKLGKDEGHYVIGDSTYLDCKFSIG